MPEFEKHIPTAFIIGTPFQLLCAVEAIREFEIDNYLIVALLDGGERDNQFVQMLQGMHVNYESFKLYDLDEMLDDYLQQKGLFSVSNRSEYERIMIGDYYDLTLWEMAYCYAKPHANIVFMDDGTASILLLKGHLVTNEPTTWYERRRWRETEFKPTMAARKKVMNKWKEKNLCCRNGIYTLFADIPSRYFKAYPNTFSHIVSARKESQDGEYICIIGTVADAFCPVMGVSIPQYEGLLWQKLSEIRSKSPNATIQYIPHGRDTNEATKLFCKALNIEYKRLDCSVEYYCIREKKYPTAIYGWGSTALFTLKKMSPTISATNWYVYNPQAMGSKDLKTLTKYYVQHDIKTDVMRFPALPIRKRISRSIKYLLCR